MESATSGDHPRKVVTTGSAVTFEAPLERPEMTAPGIAVDGEGASFGGQMAPPWEQR